MKLIYLTAKTYPATTADHFFVREMAGAFTKILSKDFLLIVANDASEDLRDVSYKNLGLKITRGLSLWYFIWLPTFIIREHFNNGDTIFLSNDPNLLTILIIWKRLLRLKYQIVSEWHMLFENWRDRFVSRNSTKLITTTNHLKNLISSKFDINDKKILTVYGGADVNRFDAITEPIPLLRNRLGLYVDAFIVGYIGFYKTMNMAKGLDTMINALALIPNKNVKMAFVGGKPQEIEEYKLIAKNMHVADRIMFVPFVSIQEVSAYEKAMDVLVIPYPDKLHFREYGFPMKAYEYMASKRPIIYSDLPIISEVLRDCALSFKPGDAKDLAEKILYFKNNPIKSKDLTNKACYKVANYTWDKRAENITAFLKGI